MVISPENQTQWIYPSRRVRQTRPGSDGLFRLRGMPPGNCFLALLTDVEDVKLGDAAFLEELAAASVRVVLVEGETTRQDVKIR